MATFEQIMDAARRADAQGDEDAARRLVQMARRVQSRSAPELEQPKDFGQVLKENLLGDDDPTTQNFGERVGSFLNRAGESMTLGVVGDEADAGARSILNGRSYEQNLADVRQQERIFADENPVAAIAADIGGALVPGLGAANTIMRGATLGTKVGRGLLAGGTAGATMGFTEGEGGLDNRVSSGAIGAGVGGLLGMAVPLAGAGLRNTFEAVAPGAQRAVRKARDSLGLEREGARMVSEAMRRDMPVSDEILREAGPDAVVAQSGPQTLGLLDAIVNRPGEYGTAASAQVQDFAAARGREFAETLDSALGQPVGAMRSKVEIMRNSAPARREAYGAAYTQPIDYSTPAGRRIESLLGRVPSRAIRDAEEMMRIAGEENLQQMASIADDGTITFTTPPDVRMLDYVTRALRDMTDPLSSGIGGSQRDAVGGLAREIRAAVDDAVPEYRAAREAGRDAIVNREAVDFGAALFARNTPMDVAEDALGQMGTAERRFAAQGARDYIDEVMANARRAQTDMNMDIREAMRPVAELTSRAGERKLTALLGEAEATRVLDAAKSAYQALSLRANVGRNSRTEPRRAVEEGLDAAVPIGMGEALAAGRGVSGAAMQGIYNVAGDPATQRLLRRDEVAGAVGRALMQPANSPQGRQVREVLPGLLARATEQSNTVEAAANRAGGVLGMYANQQNAREPNVFGLLGR